MFISVIARSDKTVASVATSHQEFHLVYIGPENIDNPTRCAHGNGILPCAFLPIPNGMVLGMLNNYNWFLRCFYSFFFFQAGRKERKMVTYQQFCHQLFHACLAYIYKPLKPAMTSPEVVRCPDGHYH